jgi:hypothetical protein
MPQPNIMARPAPSTGPDEQSVDDIVRSFVSTDLAALDGFGEFSNTPPLFAQDAYKSSSPSSPASSSTSLDFTESPNNKMDRKVQQTGVVNKLKTFGRRISSNHQAPTSNINGVNSSPTTSPRHRRASSVSSSITRTPTINMRFGTEKPATA